MVGCILTGHGEFASGLGSAVEMVAGPQDNLTVVTFRESEAGDYAARIASAIKDSVTNYGNTVVFCDLMGGTPFNQAMLVSQEVPGVDVVTGTNLPMLLECLTSISSLKILRMPYALSKAASLSKSSTLAICICPAASDRLQPLSRLMMRMLLLLKNFRMRVLSSGFSVSPAFPLKTLTSSLSKQVLRTAFCT